MTRVATVMPLKQGQLPDPQGVVAQNPIELLSSVSLSETNLSPFEKNPSFEPTDKQVRASLVRHHLLDTARNCMKPIDQVPTCDQSKNLVHLIRNMHDMDFGFGLVTRQGKHGPICAAIVTEWNILGPKIMGAIYGSVRGGIADADRAIKSINDLLFQPIKTLLENQKLSGGSESDSNILTPDPKTTQADWRMLYAFRRLNYGGFRRLPVVEHIDGEDVLVGALSSNIIAKRDWMLLHIHRKRDLLTPESLSNGLWAQLADHKHEAWEIPDVCELEQVGSILLDEAVLSDAHLSMLVQGRLGLSLSDIMARPHNLPLIHQRTSIIDAAHLMHRKDHGFAIICDDLSAYQPLYRQVFTERDIMGREILGAIADICESEMSASAKINSMRELLETPCSDIIAPQARIVLSPTDRVEKALNLMYNAGIRRIPIVGSNGELLGAVDAAILFEMTVEELSRWLQGAEEPGHWSYMDAR